MIALRAPRLPARLVVAIGLGLCPAIAHAQVNTPVVPERVGVVVFASDELPLGELPREVESGLASRFDDVDDLAIEIVPTAILAGMLAPETVAFDGEAFEAQIESARLACVNAEWDQARSILQSLSTTVEEIDPPPAHALARIRLFSTYLEWKKPDGPAKARPAARLALDLEPALKVDTTELSEVFARFIDEVRNARAKPIQVTVSGVPENTSVVVRGHAYGTKLALLPGVHGLEIRVPGAKPIFRKVDTRKSGSALEVTIAEEPTLDLDAQWGVMNEGDAIATMFEGLAQTLDVDWVVYVYLDADARAEVGVVPAKSAVVRVSAVHASPDGSVEEFAEQIVESLGRDLESAMRAGAAATATLPMVDLGRDFESAMRAAYSPMTYSSSRREGLFLGASVSFASRRHAVSGAGGTGFEADFLGTGVDVFEDIQKGPWWGRVTFGFVSHRFTNADIDLPDGTQAHALGGDSVVYEGQVGYRAWKGRAWIPSGWLLVGGSGETHWARDARTSADGRVELLPSFERTALEVGFRGSVYSSRGSPWRLGVEAAAQPLAEIVEKPKNASGSSPRAYVGWRAGVELTRRLDRASLVLSWRMEQWSARFEGTAKAETTPAVVDAHVTETSQVASLSWQYGF